MGLKLTKLAFKDDTPFESTLNRLVFAFLTHMADDKDGRVPISVRRIALAVGAREDAAKQALDRLAEKKLITVAPFNPAMDLYTIVF